MDERESGASDDGLIGPEQGEVLDAEIEQFEQGARRIAAGGWRRALIGMALGVAAGLAAIVSIPPDRS